MARDNSPKERQQKQLDNVVKYVTRHASKDGAEDLRKARHYIDLLLELQYGETPE